MSLQVREASEAAETAQAQLDEARRLAAEASEKNFDLILKQNEAEKAHAEASKEKADSKRLLAQVQKAEKDRLEVLKEIEAMPSREEISRKVRLHSAATPLRAGPFDSHRAGAPLL